MRDTKQELFNQQRYQYGCGYWNSCWEHACPCRISIEDKDICDEKIESALKDEARKVTDDLEKEFSNDDFYAMLFEDDESDYYYYNPYDDYEDLDDDTLVGADILLV